MTVSDRILETLEAAGEELTQGEIQRRVGCNRNVYKRVIARLLATGEVEVREVQTEFGPAKMHRVVSEREQRRANGQLEIDADA